MTGQEIEKRQEAMHELATEIRGEKTRAQIEKVLPPNVSIDKFERVAVTAINENADLVEVDRGSLFLALVKCAQDGLLPDGREAALIPFNDKKRGRIANYLPMIGGYRKIAAEHGWTIRTAVVYDKDEFDFELGDQPTVRHRPPRPGVDRGPKIAAYAVAAHADGRREVEVLDGTEIAKIKGTSKATSYGPWVDWEERMWEKSAGRRLFKKLPIADADRVERVLAADLDPQQATNDLYGPSAPALSSGETEDGRTSDPTAPVKQGPDSSPQNGLQQAEENVGTDGGENGPQAASILEPLPDGEGAGGSGSRADAAGDAEIPVGDYAGQKISAVAKTKAGRDFLLWSLKNIGATDPTRMAIEQYVRARLPGVWAEYMESRDEAAADDAWAAANRKAS